MTLRRYCLQHELEDDDKLIALYEAYHKPGQVWPEVLESIRASGIVNMSIYRHNATLIMLIEVDEHFSFEAKAESDKRNPKVQEWETLMDTFQKSDSNQAEKVKWKLMKSIFDFSDH